jgi:hypothetical protein
MGDWRMDERERAEREQAERDRDRDWRDHGDRRRGAEAGRRGEDRSWSNNPTDGRGAYGDRDRDGDSADLTTGGAYGRNPMGARGRYGGPARFGAQDYTGRDAGYDFQRRQDPRWRAEDGRGYSERPDWESERDDGWACFSPEDDGYPSEPVRRRDEYRGPDERRDGGDFLSRAGERISSWFRGSDLMRGSRQDEPRRYADDYRYGARLDADHRGHGPRGYKRSDERISDEAHDRLTDDRWLDATDINVTVTDGEVTLGGFVDDREAKHRAERLVEDISGVSHVQNNLRVHPDASFTGAGRGYGSSALEAEMRRDAAATDPDNNGVSGLSGRTSTGAAADRPTRSDET